MSNEMQAKGYASRDSMTRCSYQPDLYTVGRSPAAPQRAPIGYAHKDSIDTVQKKLEREAEKTLKQGGLQLSPKLLFLARLGRAVFLLLMLPPYVVIYSLPRFILTEALPYAFKSVLRPVIQVVRQIKERIKAVKAGLKAMALFLVPGFLKQPRKERKPLVRRLHDAVVARFNKVVHFLLAPVRYVKELRQRIVSTIRAGIQRQKDKLKTAVSSAVASVRRKMYQQFERLGNVIHHTFVQPVVDWIKPRHQAVRVFVTDAKQRIEGAYRAVRREVQAFIKDPADSMSRLRDAVVSRVYSFAEKVSEKSATWAKKQIEELTSIGRDLRARGYDLVADRLKLAREEIQGWYYQTINFAAHTYKSCRRIAAELPGKIVPVKVKKALHWLQQQKQWAQQRYSQFQQAAEERINRGKDDLKVLVSMFKKEGIGILRKLFGWLLLKLRAVPSQLMAGGRWVGAHAMRLFRLSVYQACVALAWTKVLFRQGMARVRAISRRVNQALGRWIKKRSGVPH